MNPDAKLVAAAQRAARKIARADAVPYQSCLDAVARRAGRSTWSAFLADPVPIDDAARASAAEPDFTETSPDAHLNAAIDYGTDIGARAFLAIAATPTDGERLVYCSSRGDGFDHPVDARGLSTAAMIVALAALPRGERGGFVRNQDADIAYEVDDLGEGRTQLRVSLDAAMPPEAPVADAADATIRDTRRRRLAIEEAAVASAAPIAPRGDASDILTDLIELAWSVPGADMVLEPRRDGYDAVLTAGRVRRIVHGGDFTEYHQLRATAKDRGRMDQMEFRIQQHGEYEQEIAGRHQRVHVMTTPAEMPGFEGVHLGPRPFARRVTAPPIDVSIAIGGAIPLGEHGVFTRSTQHADQDALVVVSGRPGSGRTSRFVIPAIAGIHGVDIVVSDMRGDLAGRLGGIWDDHPSRMRIAPLARSASRRAPAFNPFHPDMMPEGHVNAAAWVADVLLHGDDDVSAGARDVFVAAVDLMVSEIDHRPAPADPDAVATLPMVAQWLSAHLADAGAIAATLTGSPAIQARRRLENFAGLDPATSRAVERRLREARAFVAEPSMDRLLAPVEEDRGAAIAHALALRRQPTLVVVSPGQGPHHDRLVALVMQAVAQLRGEQAPRRTHLHVDDAEVVGPMPWLSQALVEGMPNGFSASVVLDAPTGIDDLAPTRSEGRLPGVNHWLLEEIQEARQRHRVADAMGIRRSKVSTHRADDRRLDVTASGVRMLRR